MNQESYSLSRDTEVLVKALLLALIEEEDLQAMTALKESLIEPIKIGKTLSIILETQVMTRAEITHFTVEVEKEGQEAVAITEEIEDKEAVAIVETIGNAAMTEAEEEEVMTETEEVIDQKAMKEHVAMIIKEEEKMIEKIVVTKEGVIAEIATLEETELEANLETISLIPTGMIDVAVSLQRTETAAPQTAI